MKYSREIKIENVEFNIKLQSGYGLYLENIETDILANRLKNISKKKIHNDNILLEQKEIIEEHFDAVALFDYTEKETHMKFLKDNKEIHWDHYRSNGAILFADKKNGSIFKNSNDLYNSIDEIVDEFKEKLKKLLPEDFDYEGNIVYAQVIMVE